MSLINLPEFTVMTLTVWICQNILLFHFILFFILSTSRKTFHLKLFIDKILKDFLFKQWKVETFHMQPWRPSTTSSHKHLLQIQLVQSHNTNYPQEILKNMCTRTRETTLFTWFNQTQCASFQQSHEQAHSPLWI